MIDLNYFCNYNIVSGIKIDERRVRVLSKTNKISRNHGGGVLYWMWREQRVQGLKKCSQAYCTLKCHSNNSSSSADNWALIFAQQMALEKGLPLHICFCLDEERFLHSPPHYRPSVFMGEGIYILLYSFSKNSKLIHLFNRLESS